MNLGPVGKPFGKEAEMDDLQRSQDLSEQLMAYAQKHDLKNTVASLSIIRKYSKLVKNKSKIPYYLANCQGTAKMLSEINLPFDTTELDYALSAALLHTISKHVSTINFEREMTAIYGIDPRICEIVKMITLNGQTSDEELTAFYDQIKTDRIALIVRLTERSNLVERLSEVTALKAKVQISDTKRYFFPMCVYAKIHYPELTPAIAVLMEKMRNLMDVAEILIEQFDQREKDLSRDILELLEENTRIRSLIAKLEGN